MGRMGDFLLGGTGGPGRAVGSAEAGYAYDVLKDLVESERIEGGLAQQYVAAAHKAVQTILTAPMLGTAQGRRPALHTLGGAVTSA